MDSRHALKEFVSERLNAAASEMSAVFERTLVRYEEQIERQRGLLHITGKPQIKLHGAENPLQHVFEEEQLWEQEEQQSDPSMEADGGSDLRDAETDDKELLSHKSVRWFINVKLSAAAGEILSMIERTVVQQEEQKAHGTENPQQLCNQETNTSLDQENPEPPQCKEEQEELCIIQVEQQPGPKQESDGGNEEMFSQSSVAEFTSNDDDDEKLPELEPNIIKLKVGDASHHQQLSVMRKPEFHRIECRQQHVCNEEQVGNQECTSSLWQEESAPPPIKEEQEELSTHLEGTQLVLIQETDFERDHSGAGPGSVVPLFTYSAVAESQGWKQDQYVDSGPSRHAELEQNVIYYNQMVNSSAATEGPSGNEKGDDSLECDVCGKIFKSVAIKKKHYKVHSGEKPYSCSECSKSFKRKFTLTIHKRTHTGEKPYSCSECSKSFSQRSTLTTHQKTHSGEKPYFCSECNKSFNMQRKLIVHMRTHTGEKPYSCPDCSKSFRQLSSFVIHKRTHTGEKPYSCTECSKSFRHLSSFFTHKRIHSGEKPYSCSECSKRFNDHSHWKIHMRRHTGEKPYSCGKCPESFALRRSFLRHMKKHTDSTSQS